MNPPSSTGPDEAYVKNILAGFDQVFGLHPGFRPAHAKGAMYTGTFTPAPAAATLTRAPHVTRATTPVVVRFSDSAGVPTVPDNDPLGASPRGFALRFYLAEHVHTDIIGHSYNGFMARTGEEFLEFLHAIAGSGPGVPHPTPIETFLGGHPQAAKFVLAPKPIPTSFARESFYGVTAFKFTNAGGASRFGRFQILPLAGNEYFDATTAAKQSPNFLFDELEKRVAQGPVKFRIVVQLADESDDVNDASTPWPDIRTLHEFGTVEVTALANATDPEMQKIIFDPVPRVDGIDPSNDPLIAVRSAVYLMSGRRRRAAAAK